MAREYARRFTCEEGFRDSKRLLGFAEARIKCLAAWTRMFTLVAVALLVVTRMGCALLERADHEELLRRVRSRREARTELSLARSVVELVGAGRKPLAAARSSPSAQSGGRFIDVSRLQITTHIYTPYLAGKVRFRSVLVLSLQENAEVPLSYMVTSTYAVILRINTRITTCC
jgi:hypothetical protein